MNYSSPSPVPYGVAAGPGTPLMQSPQDTSGEMNYSMMKNVSGGMNVMIILFFCFKLILMLFLIVLVS
jgi:hypothetical protein